MTYPIRAGYQNRKARRAAAGVQRKLKSQRMKRLRLLIRNDLSTVQERQEYEANR